MPVADPISPSSTTISKTHRTFASVAIQSSGEMMLAYLTLNYEFKPTLVNTRCPFVQSECLARVFIEGDKDINKVILTGRIQAMGGTIE
jgi:hypothetical protein